VGLGGTLNSTALAFTSLSLNGINFLPPIVD
jgi:hypothetical protein